MLATIGNKCPTNVPAVEMCMCGLTCGCENDTEGISDKAQSEERVKEGRKNTNQQYPSC